MNFHAIFFDLDGTLLDTLADIAGACNAALKAAGLPEHPVERYRRWVGGGFPRTVAQALEAHGADADTAAGIVTAAREFYAAHPADHTAPYPGIGDALGALASQGIRLGVLSNKPEDLVIWLLRRFFPDIPFAAAHGAVSGRPLKPDPAFALAMLNGLGLEPGHCAYVGDSDVDMALARACGFFPVGLAWGFRGPAELELAGAPLILRETSQLARPGEWECP